MFLRLPAWCRQGPALSVAGRWRTIHSPRLVAGLTLFTHFHPTWMHDHGTEFWHERWERSEIGFHQQDINVHLQQFWTQLDLRPGQRVFAPLCGKSRDLLWLAGEGHPVTGVEISRLAVEAFSPRTAEATMLAGRSVRIWEVDEIRILLGDFFDLEPQHLADAAGIYDRLR